MSAMENISLERSVFLATAQRAEQEGLSVEDYVTRVLLRELELDPRERTIVAYNAAEPGSDFILDRGGNESDEAYEARSATLRMLFP